MVALRPYWEKMMIASRRRLPLSLSFFAALSLAFLANAFFLPSVAYAHGYVPDGHAGGLYGVNRVPYALLTLLLLVGAGAILRSYFHRRRYGQSLSPILGLFALISIASLVA